MKNKKNLNNCTMLEMDKFCARILTDGRVRPADLACLAASAGIRKELVEGGLSILCERAFRLKTMLKHNRISTNLGARIDDYAKWNTLRQVLGHGASTDEFLGLRMEDRPR